MFVKITLFKTDFDEENIFIPTNTEYPFFDFQPKMEDRLRLLKEKYEFLELPKSAYNPREPFSIAKNAFDIKGVYNYAVFDFDTEKSENENTPVNKYRYYFIRDIVFVNDNISRLIVKEDILPRVYNYIDIKQCLPESYTYKKSRIKKRDYKNLISDNMYKSTYGNSKTKTIYNENGLPIYQLYFLVVSCLLENQTDSSYLERGTFYPFANVVLPVIYNVDEGKILSLSTGVYYNFALSQSVEPARIATSYDFYDLFYATNAGFKVLGTCLISNLPCVSDFQYSSSGTYRFLITFNKSADVNKVNFTFQTQRNIDFLRLGIGNDDYYNDIDTNNAFFEDFFDEYGKIGYKKIVLSCSQNDLEIDPVLFLSKETFEKKDYIVFEQSLVPPYNVFFGVRSNFTDGDNTGLLYYDKFGLVVSNTLSAGTYTDNYTEFLRTNYNSTITGLSVQQSANRELLGVQQDLQMTQFAYSTQKKVVKETAKAWLTGGLSAIGFAVNTGVDFANLQATQEASRESLSINQEKENALLELKIADIKNTPDTASFYGSVGDCIKNCKYPRITFWENVSLGVAKRGHKIFGFTLPQNINKIQSHNRFDYLRTKDLTLSFINGFSPTELERAEIEDTLNKGIRIWWTLDNYKNFDLENAEV